MKKQVNPDPVVIRHIEKDDGQFPNSSLFVLIYKKVFGEDCSASDFEDTFAGNDWKNSWRNGIYDYHHYHSITHEVLGIYDGTAKVQFGGPSGIIDILEKGDVVIIPAGVAHKCIESEQSFKCVGAYPDGLDFDIKKGDPSERPEADENISKVLLPDKDPVYGAGGLLALNWEMQ
jgi:uncharacterized protein YjlB